MWVGSVGDFTEMPVSTVRSDNRVRWLLDVIFSFCFFFFFFNF